MDVTAANLLGILRRTSAPPEQKLTLLSNLKSDIKHYRVPENAQATIFECLKLAITQQTSINIVTAALSTLGHLVKRLKIQDPDGKSITTLAPRLWPALQERLGDTRDSHRAAALQAFIDLHPFCAHDVERIIRDDCIVLGSVRAKEMGMQWVVTMHIEHDLQFKPFVAAMVACLEDADGQVRDAAKAAVVELFRPASSAAKNDLKKQLKLHNIRQSITAQILAQIGAAERTAPLAETDFAASTRSVPALDHTAHFAASVTSEEAKPPSAEDVKLDPVFVHSQRELEDIFRDMAPHFEGRESEENWGKRDNDVKTLRRLTKGNAPSEYHSAYMSGLKGLQEGIIKVASSLRTTTASNGCYLVAELARTLGPAMDSMVESFLQAFIKMCAATKSIAAQNGNTTADTIFQYVTYNVSLSRHILLAAQDKNKSPRIFAAGWLRTVLGRQAGSKQHFEHAGGLELAEKTIKKGLTDADPKVKESMRATYWAFARLWPERANAIMNTLDDKAKIALEKDSHNPNAASMPNFAASTSSRTSGARSALRDKILAAKRDKGAPPRPTTAMASMSPSKSKSMANIRAKAVMGPPSTTRQASNVSVASTATVDSTASSAATPSATRPNSLMSGAARRPVKRPEIARPATADPYASRRIGRPETPSEQSPGQTPRQHTITRTPAAQSTLAKSRAGRAGSPASPLRLMNGSKSTVDHRPTSRDAGDSTHLSGSLIADDLTMVMPGSIMRDTLSSAARRRPAHEKAHSIDAGMQGLGINDDFTFVLPANHDFAAREDRRSASRSPAQNGSESLVSQARYSPITMRAASPLATMKSASGARPPSAQERVPQRAANSQTEAVQRPTVRQSSPLRSHTTAVEDEVKIYEDPLTSSVHGHTDERMPGVLNELPLNESSPPNTADPNNPTAPTFSHPSLPPPKSLAETPLSPPQSPQSKAEKLRSRKLLQSGIARIRARTLDTHGYRKVLELTRTIAAEDLFGQVLDVDAPSPGLYEALLSSLMEFISTPPGTTPTPDRPNATKGSSNEVKRQVFTLLRALLRREDEPVATWNNASRAWARAYDATLRSRRFVEGSPLVVKDIEALVVDATTQRLSAPETLDITGDFLREQIHAGGRSAAYNSWANGSSNGEHSAADELDDMLHNGVHHNDDGPDKETGKAAAQASALALRALAACLSTSGPASAGPLIDIDRATVVAKQLAVLLRANDAETRKAATECAVELYEAWPAKPSSSPRPSANGNSHGQQNGVDRAKSGMGIVSRVVRDKEGFWAALDGGDDGAAAALLPEGTKNLIVYFIARRQEGAH